MKRGIRAFFAFLLILSMITGVIPAERAGAEEGSAVCFEDPGRLQYYVNRSGKPGLSELTGEFPSELYYTLDGEEELREVKVTWESFGDDYETTDRFYYRFVPVFDEGSREILRAETGEDFDLFIEVFVREPGGSSDAFDGSPVLEGGSSDEVIPGGYNAGVNSNEKTIYSYLTGTMGLNCASACGILANIYAESSFRPDIAGDGGTSYGICQWHNTRFENLKKYCDSKGYDWHTLEGQLNFLNYELNSDTYYKNILKYMKNSIENSAEGSYEAGRYWCLKFEIPANKETVSKNRGKLSQETFYPVYSKKADPTPTPTSTPTPTPTPEPEPEEVLYGVLSEDREGIKEGEIWAAGIRDSFVYDGSSKKQDFRLYYGVTRLIKGKDYTVSYKNNIKAYEIEDLETLSDEDLEKAPRLTVTLRGSYEGTINRYFSITRPDISDDRYAYVKDITVKYTGKKQMPSPVLYYEGKKLKYGKDFTVNEYKDADPSEWIGDKENRTEKELTLTGLGNYTGERKITLTILAKGEKMSGASSEKKRISLSRVKVNGISAQTYRGQTIGASELIDDSGESCCPVLTYNKLELREGIDYIIEEELINPLDAGSATLVIHGLSSGGEPGEGISAFSFTGVKKVKVKIKALPVSDESISVYDEGALSAVFSPEGAKPVLKLEYDGVRLRENVDYTVRFYNNKAIRNADDDKAPYALIKGKGNFSGKRKVFFSITGQ